MTRRVVEEQTPLQIATAAYLKVVASVAESSDDM